MDFGHWEAIRIHLQARLTLESLPWSKGFCTVYIVGTSKDDIWTYDTMVFKSESTGGRQFY